MACESLLPPRQQNDHDIGLDRKPSTEFQRMESSVTWPRFVVWNLSVDFEQGGIFNFQTRQESDIFVHVDARLLVARARD